MNCHHARQLISPYLDHQLTGHEMLALQEHFAECESCEAERRSIQQVKMLLRALHEPHPRTDLPDVIALRLSEAEQPVWHLLFLSASPPPRGRRLATALALSCLTILSFAASVLAPASHDGALTSSAFLLPTDLSPTRPLLTDEMSLQPLAAPQTDGLVLTDAGGLRRERFFRVRPITSFRPVTASPTDLRLSLLPYGASPDSLPGEVTLAGDRSR